MGIELPLSPAEKEPRCTIHPTEDAGRCRNCRSEWIAAPDHSDLAMGDADATTARAMFAKRDLDRRREIAAARWDAKAPREFATARLDDFRDRPDAMVTVRQLLDHFESYNEPPLWLRIVGPVGTGKTRLMWAALRAAIEGSRPIEWTATSALAMYRGLRPSSPNPDVVMYKLQTVPLLLIDDLGAGKYSEFNEDMVLELLDARYERGLPVWLTTNLNTKDLGEAVGPRNASRLKQRCARILLDGEDRRRAPQLEGLAAV
jgi:DNA replication protein DnaC